MVKYEELSVLLEESGELLFMNVLPADAIRARNDSAYLLQLVNEEQERNRQSRLSPSVEGTTNQEKESSTNNWCPDFEQQLLTLYEEHGGIDGPNDIMKTIALSMQQQGYDISWGQCQHYLNNLKRNHKQIMTYNASGFEVNRANLAQMRRIFGKNSQAQPEALDSEAGSSSPKTPKRRKLESIRKKYCAVTEVRISSRKVREINKQERHKIKLKKIEEMMAQKERQRKEKIEIMDALLEAISKND